MPVSYTHLDVYKRQDSVLVAHNATFDVGFMNVNYERHGLPKIIQPVIDTLEFARNLYPEYKRHGDVYKRQRLKRLIHK